MCLPQAYDIYTFCSTTTDWPQVCHYHQSTSSLLILSNLAQYQKETAPSCLASGIRRLQKMAGLTMSLKRTQS